MKFSVVVPAYNYGRFLKGCLDSVAAQEGVDWECLVIDDGSTDDTPEVARERCGSDPRFTYIRQENAGLSPTRNKGLENAQGQWVAFLDADDQYYPGALAALAQATHRPGAVMVAGRTSTQGKDRNPPAPDKVGQTAARVAGFLDPVLTTYPSTVAVRKDVLKLIGGFPVRDGRDLYPALEDRATWIQVVARGSLTVVNEVITWYRRGHPESLQSAGQVDGRILASAIKLYADLLEDQLLKEALGEEAEDFFRLCRAHLLNGRAVETLIGGRHEEAGALWNEALGLCSAGTQRQALVKALEFLIPGSRTDTAARLEERARCLRAFYQNSSGPGARRLLRESITKCLLRLTFVRARGGRPGLAGRAALNAWLRSPTPAMALTLARRTVAHMRRREGRRRPADPPFA